MVRVAPPTAGINPNSTGLQNGCVIGSYIWERRDTQSTFHRRKCTNQLFLIERDLPMSHRGFHAPQLHGAAGRSVVINVLTIRVNTPGISQSGFILRELCFFAIGYAGFIKCLYADVRYVGYKLNPFHWATSRAVYEERISGYLL